MLPPVRNRHGELLDLGCHPVPPARALPGPRTLALVAHGVTSNKDRPYLVELSESLARAGITAVRISFAGNGASEGRFEDATPTKEVEDLGCVIDAAVAAGFPRIACIGHSMGGAVCLLRAAADPRVAALVSLAGMVHVAAFMSRHFGALRPGDPMLGRPECPWSAALAADAARLGSLLPQAATIAVPWLLLHGDADELVPLSDSTDAVAAARSAGHAPTLVTLPAADHRFSGAGTHLARLVTEWLVARASA